MPISPDYHDNTKTPVSLPNVTITTVSGGGACTQAAYNANSCLNVTNDNVTLNAFAYTAQVRHSWRGVGYQHRADLELTS